MNRRELRPLKAAAERKEQPSTGYTNPKRQKTITKVACNACRSKKSAVSVTLINLGPRLGPGNGKSTHSHRTSATEGDRSATPAGSVARDASTSPSMNGRRQAWP